MYKINRTLLEQAVRFYSPYGKKHDEVMAKARVRMPEMIRRIIEDLWMEGIPPDANEYTWVLYQANRNLQSEGVIGYVK